MDKQQSSETAIRPLFPRPNSLIVEIRFNPRIIILEETTQIKTTEIVKGVTAIVWMDVTIQITDTRGPNSSNAEPCCDEFAGDA